MTLLHFRSAATNFLPAVPAAAVPLRTASSPAAESSIVARRLGLILRALGLWILDGSTWEETHYRKDEGFMCGDCRTVHWLREGCPRALEGECLDCGRVRVLSRFGNCSKCGSHSIIKRRLQHRFTLLKKGVMP